MKRRAYQLYKIFEQLKLTNRSRLFHYLQEIYKYPYLTGEEEFDLAIKIREQNDFDALKRLVRCNLRIVIPIAQRYQNYGLSLIDLINAGNEGLIHAAQKFDNRKGVRFYWYAIWWIKNAIYHALATDRSIIPKSSLARKIQIQTSKFIKKKGREPTTDELSKILKVDKHKISLAQAELLPSYSLDQIYEFLDRDAEKENGEFCHQFHQRNFKFDDRIFSPSLDKLHIKKLRRDILKSALRKLSRRERQIVEMHFGLGDYEPHSLAKIACQFGISRERVRQIRNNAIKKLKVEFENVATSGKYFRTLSIYSQNDGKYYEGDEYDKNRRESK